MKTAMEVIYYFIMVKLDMVQLRVQSLPLLGLYATDACCTYEYGDSEMSKDKSLGKFTQSHL
jgi:hypothetical protein